MLSGLLRRTFALATIVAASFGSEALAANCEYAAPPANLPTGPGQIQFMSNAQLAPFMEFLPQVGDHATDAVMRNAQTMWYDEGSMVFSYQDSQEFVVGFRANCVGRVIAELSRDHPQVGKLLQLFGEDFRFRFPFRKAAGTDLATNSKTINFWLPPRDGAGNVLPVRWWKESGRGRWRWLFPVGTVFGEVLYQTGPDQKLYPFEVRTRKRYLEGWQIDSFRPFADAQELARAVKTLRPAWQSAPNLTALITHLEDPGTLRAHRLESPAFARVFPAIDGALDPLPDFGDAALVKELLTTFPFNSTEGRIWKENGQLETYAPSSRASFSIVPNDYEMGMIASNEDSCNRCHVETGRRLGYFIPDIDAYGEIWGEDRIFTWHLFQVSERIYGPWDDDQGSRQINPRMVRAGLVQQGRPTTQDPNYRELPRPSETQH